MAMRWYLPNPRTKSRKSSSPKLSILNIKHKKAQLNKVSETQHCSLEAPQKASKGSPVVSTAESLRRSGGGKLEVVQGQPHRVDKESYLEPLSYFLQPIYNQGKLFIPRKYADWNIISGKFVLKTLIDIVWRSVSVCHENCFNSGLVFFFSLFNLAEHSLPPLEILLFWFMNVFKFLRFSKPLFHL